MIIILNLIVINVNVNRLMATLLGSLDINQCFSNSNVHLIHVGLVKNAGRSGLKPEILPF